MLRIAICDDISKDRDDQRMQLISCLGKWEYPFDIVEYSWGEDLANAYETTDLRFDMIFLDIIMDGPTGMKIAERIRKADINAVIIFVTSSPDYAVEGYEVEAMGYLLKPVNEERLVRLLKRFFKDRAASEESYFLITSRREKNKIPHKDILYIESRKNDVFIHCKDGEIHQLRAKLNEVEKMISQPNFFRSHQSYLVNMDHVMQAADDFIMCDGSVVPIRMRERKAIREYYFDYAVMRCKRRMDV